MTTATELAAQWNLRAIPGRREWRGTCPLCGYASAAMLTERNGRPLAWCASCQDRDGFAALIRGTVVSTPPPDPKPERDAEAVRKRRRKRALALWNGAEPIPGTPAERYLCCRALPQFVHVPALRFRADTPHPGGGRHAAMLAVIVDIAGSPMAAHRTFIGPDGHKAALEPVKASLGHVKGGAIRLAPEAPEITIGEGIETSAAAGVLLGLPAWAAVSAGNLARHVQLPPTVRRIVIAADNDGPGQRAALDAARRWRTEGREVRIVVPDRAGEDFADVLLHRVGGAA